jgi:hypothetical protein
MLVNEIGSSSGSKAVQIPSSGTYLLQVQADGPWTIQVEYTDKEVCPRGVQRAVTGVLCLLANRSRRGKA